MRFKRWILHRAIVADIAVQCASVSINRSLNGSGGVYALDVPTPTRREPPLVQLRQFQGKGFQKLGASFASDSVYSIDKNAQLYLLRGRDNFTDSGESPVLAKKDRSPLAARRSEGQAEGGGWHLAGRWLSILKKEVIAQVVPGGHHAVCRAAGGDAFSWGLNPHGELGSNHAFNMTDRQEPLAMTLIPEGETIVSVSAGVYHGAAVSQSGRVYCWGCNTSNELAQVNTFTEDIEATFFSAPVYVDLDSPSYKLKPKASSNKDAVTKTRLSNDRDHSSLATRSTYVFHRWLIRTISCGAAHTACIDQDGRVLTWGCRDGGRLGRRDTAWPSQSPSPEDEELSFAATRRKQRPQQGAPPGEVDSLWESGKMCIDLCCGAWHTLLLVVDRQHDRIKADSLTSTRLSNSPHEVEQRCTGGTWEIKRPTEVLAFGSGISGQLGIGDKTLSLTPMMVRGLPRGGNESEEPFVLNVRAGTYVSACADSNGQVWSWGARGAGMFQAQPRLVALPKGQRSGGLVDFCCTRDSVVFATSGVGQEYFEELVELKISTYRKQRLADEVCHSIRFCMHVYI